MYKKSQFHKQITMNPLPPFPNIQQLTLWNIGCMSNRMLKPANQGPVLDLHQTLFLLFSPTARSVVIQPPPDHLTNTTYHHHHLRTTKPTNKKTITTNEQLKQNRKIHKAKRINQKNKFTLYRFKKN